MKKNLLVSVIVPVFNGEETIDECLLSIQGQTYSNLEILVIDDGSTDSTLELISQRTKDQRLKLIHQKNTGSSGARNTGLRNCVGDIIAFVDADDWIEPNFLERMLAGLTGLEREIVMCSILDNQGVFKQYANCKIQGENLFRRLMDKEISGRVMNKIYTRATVDSIFFPEDKCMREDGVWTAKVLAQCDQLVSMGDLLYHYRKTENSLSRRKNHTPQEIAQFWFNSLERDLIIRENLTSMDDLKKSKAKLLEHIEEAMEDERILRYYDLGKKIQGIRELLK